MSTITTITQDHGIDENNSCKELEILAQATEHLNLQPGSPVLDTLQFTFE